MVEVLEFIFRDFWTWFGTAALLTIITMPIKGTKVVRKDEEDEK